MPDSNDNKLNVELIPCSLCGNPFLAKKGQIESKDLVCDNCIKLQARKKELLDSVVSSQKEIKSSIKEMENQANISESIKNKEEYLENIKSRSELLTKSIELLKKIEETNDQKYIDEYKNLFDKLKKSIS
ncbi:hypothetical protein LCGC14_2078150 [marine sediment metagenome]|uniref:Uncharacterized protein n=1 Tax=marine sediment metagenome TaxID=412755 RepID=A0A0F9HDB2_9ZZZZ